MFETKVREGTARGREAERLAPEPGRRRMPAAVGVPAALALAAALAACGGEAEPREAEADRPEAQAGEELSPAEADPAPGAEGTAGSRTDAPAVPVVEEGSVLVFEVLDEVSTGSHSEGDVFRLRLVDDVRGSGGAFLPAGTVASGTVTEAHRSRDADEEAVLVVAVTAVEVDGEPRSIRGTVEAASIDAAARDSGTRTTAKVVTGTAAGAVVGRILGGDRRSAVKGAVVGTVVGAGVALTTRDGHAVLPRGALLTVRLDENMPMS